MLFDILTDRYILYGEWLYPKHKIYYDALPDYFMEFDILDKESGIYLDTPSRHALLGGTDIVSVPVLYLGEYRSEKDTLSYLDRSHYITDGHLDALRATCERLGLDYESVLAETATETLMEGLYIKVEADGAVKERMKFVRYGYTQTVEMDESRWLSKPIVPNGRRRTE